MNRGVVQSSPVQQMMMAAGNPNWWNINHTMRPPVSDNNQQPSSSPFFFFSSPLPSSSNNFISPYPPASSPPFPSNWHANQDQLPDSWSNLLMGEEEEEEGKKMGNWEEQVLMSEPQNVALVDVKQETSPANSYVYGGHGGGNSNEEFPVAATAIKPGGGTVAAIWSHHHHHHHQIVPPAAASSPQSCVTSFSSNMLDFSTTKIESRHPPPDRSSECNSNGGGGAVKKARVQPSTTTQSSFKVRKEKLGDRITALHQLVSPFGKTDTASVLLEAIGYIRFLQSHIEALSLPYLGTITTGSSSSNMRNHRSVQGEKNCIFPEDPGQLLNGNGLKRKADDEQELQEEAKKDLKSRGLCLVPVSCTLQVGSDNGADYWAPALGGGFR
ncbi:transcription factor bHLH68 isoform X2 [Prosopis cineraria]|uniref:transcription factor bHLH68 isoform X2 n=1 Tax=Prosopis cineraria TaxID=364024 RepID=UPI00240F5D6D|nr:transcription factor bHLH68 isoform X2 [Prosopis cineraria]